MTTRYLEPMGKHAGAAARRASQGQDAEALKRARDAAAEGQLLHPESWGLWTDASDEVFEKALALISAKELAGLQAATSAHDGESWAHAFAVSPRKLKAMMSLGLDPQAARCKLGSVEMEPAIRAAWGGDVGRLLTMMECGMSPPAALSQPVARALDPSEPKTAAHLLARATMRSWSWGEKHAQPQVERVLGWLLEGEGAGVRARNAKGHDALKYAIREGGLEVALASLALGANPWERDAKGLDAFELLAKTLAEPGAESAARRRHLEGLAPAMRAAREARELDAAASAGAATDSRPRPRV